MSLDLERQVFVTLSFAFGLVGVLAGVGILGTPVLALAEGAFAPDYTRLAPAQPAFLLWRLIYLGLLAFTIWQWTPTARANERIRSVGWLMGLSMILNASWLLVTQRGLLWLGVTCAAAILVALVVVAERLRRIPAVSRVEFAVLDVTVGLYLGWMCLAVPANVTAVFVRRGVVVPAGVRDALAVTVLTVLVAVVLFATRRILARLAFCLAIAWGLGWIAWGRLADSPYSPVVGVAAAIGVVVVLVGAVLEEMRPGRHPRIGTNRAAD